MSLNWKELKISQLELAEIVDFDLLSTWAINISRVLLLDLKAYQKSLLLTESCSLFLFYLFIFPINLIVFRNFNWLSNNTSGLILILVSTSIISILIMLILNYYLWRKAKQVKVFAVLLEKVKQYNDLINNLKLVEKLNLLNEQQINNDHQEIESELKKALILTKNSLIRSIQLEKIINRDCHLADNRYHLLANLESSLVSLGSLSQHDSNDYQQLFSEAIEIGLSVHQEIRKTQTLRQKINE